VAPITEGERLRKGITLCPKCYEKGKRSILVYDKLLDKIMCQERQHEWTSEEWLKEVDGWKKPKTSSLG